VNDALDVLLKHVVHHFWVSHHVDLRCGNFPFQKPGFFSAKVSLSYFDGLFWEPFRVLAEMLRSSKTLGLTYITRVFFCFKKFKDVDLVFRHIARNIGVFFEQSTVKSCVSDCRWLKELIFGLIHVAHAKNSQELHSCHQYAKGQKHVVSDARVD